jgi:hypothetical protein
MSILTLYVCQFSLSMYVNSHSLCMLILTLYVCHFSLSTYVTSHSLCMHNSHLLCMHNSHSLCKYQALRATKETRDLRARPGTWARPAARDLPARPVRKVSRIFPPLCVCVCVCVCVYNGIMCIHCVYVSIVYVY